MFSLSSCDARLNDPGTDFKTVIFWTPINPIRMRDCLGVNVMLLSVTPHRSPESSEQTTESEALAEILVETTAPSTVRLTPFWLELNVTASVSSTNGLSAGQNGKPAWKYGLSSSQAY